MFTLFFYEVVSSEAANNENDFEGEEATTTYWVASNRDLGMEYRIVITPNEEEQYMIQDFDENKKFTLPTSEHGICTVVARMKETPNDVQTLEINF